MKYVKFMSGEIIGAINEVKPDVATPGRTSEDDDGLRSLDV
jgi:hypothetical protein